MLEVLVKMGFKGLALYLLLCRCCFIRFSFSKKFLYIEYSKRKYAENEGTTRLQLNADHRLCNRHLITFTQKQT